MKKIITLLLTLAMLLALNACGSTDFPQTAVSNTTVSETTAPDQNSAVTILGNGETVFSLSVADVEGSKTDFEIHTNETTVGSALLSLGLISGDNGDYGLYIHTVNGLTADWDADQTYWAFYINGEYAMTGVDTTEIDPAASYALVLTKG